jgi:hypothetical protein
VWGQCTGSQDFSYGFTEVRCYGDSSGDITVNICPSSFCYNGAPYTFTWYNGQSASGTPLFTEVTNNSFSKLDSIPSGWYTVTLVNSFGCAPQPLSIFVTQQPKLSFFPSNLLNVTCNNGVNGSITVRGTGGYIGPPCSGSCSHRGYNVTWTGQTFRGQNITGGDPNCIVNFGNTNFYVGKRLNNRRGSST